MVKWTQPAKQDLKQIYDFIALESNYYAQKVIQPLVKETESLETFLHNIKRRENRYL